MRGSHFWPFAFPCMCLCQRILPALISTESGQDTHWHHWRRVPDQMATLAYFPLMHYSALSLSTLTCFSLYCSLFLSLNYFLLIYLKTINHSFPALSFCSRGCHHHPTPQDAVTCEFHLRVCWGHLAVERKRLAVPLHGLLGSIFLVPARARCVYREAPAELLCLWDHLWEHGEQELLVFAFILRLDGANIFSVPTAQCLELLLL